MRNINSIIKMIAFAHMHLHEMELHWWTHFAHSRALRSTHSLAAAECAAAVVNWLDGLLDEIQVLQRLLVVIDL